MPPIRNTTPLGSRALELRQFDDGTLVGAVLSGDRAAGEELCVRLGPVVRGLMRKGLGPDGEYDDLVHDVFLNLLRDLSKLRDPRALRSFVYAVTANILKNELRRRKLRRMVGLTASGDLPEPKVEDGRSGAVVALTRFYQLLDDLSALNRTVFVLRQLEGCSLAEVAEATGVSLATVKRRFKDAEGQVLARVKRDPTLREFLDGYGGVEARAAHE